MNLEYLKRLRENITPDIESVCIEYMRKDGRMVGASNTDHEGFVALPGILDVAIEALEEVERLEHDASHVVSIEMCTCGKVISP